MPLNGELERSCEKSVCAFQDIDKFGSATKLKPMVFSPTTHIENHACGASFVASDDDDKENQGHSVDTSSSYQGDTKSQGLATAEASGVGILKGKQRSKDLIIISEDQDAEDDSNSPREEAATTSLSVQGSGCFTPDTVYVDSNTATFNGIYYLDCNTPKPQRLRTKPVVNKFTSSTRIHESEESSEPEPDVDIIAAIIAKAALPSLGRNITVSFYRRGRHNKAYTIHSTDSPSPSFEYLFRVCSLHDAYLKISSEVATMALLRQETTIPIPEIVAYDPSPDNALGYAWVIMKFVEGHNLEETWDKYTFAQKEDICRELKGYMDQMVALPRVPAIGSVYFANDLSAADTSSSFVIGPEVDVTQGHYHRPSRGPFPTILFYLLSELTNLTARAATYDQERLDQESDYRMTNTPLFEKLQCIVRTLCEESTCTHFGFVHPDLVRCNVLVSPSSAGNRIAAIIDWEGTMAIPSAFTSKVLGILDQQGRTFLLEYKPVFACLVSSSFYSSSARHQESRDRTQQKVEEIERLQSGVGRMPLVCACDETLQLLRQYIILLQETRNGKGRGVLACIQKWEEGGMFCDPE